MIISESLITTRPPRKVFVNNKAKKFQWAWVWKVVWKQTLSTSLKPLYQEMQRIENNNLPCIAFLGEVKEGHSDCHNRKMKHSKGNVPHMVADPIITELAFDWDDGKSGSNINTQPCHGRVKALEGEHQFLEGQELVAQLTSKAGLKGKYLDSKGDVKRYEDVIALRTFHRLSKPERLSEVRKVLTEYRQGQVADTWHLDTAVLNGNSAILLTRPELINTPVTDSVFDSPTTIHREGKPLVLDSLRKSKTGLQGKSAKDKFSIIANSFNTRTKKEVEQELKNLGDEGYFDATTRHLEHFKLISRAEAQYGDSSWMRDIIVSNHKILGTNSYPEKIDDLVLYVKRRQRDYLSCNTPEGETLISQHNFDFRELIDAPYLNEDNYQKTVAEIAANNYKGILCVKSGHGTAKTTSLVKDLMRHISTINKNASVLYITNRNSNILKASKDLNLDCHLLPDGKTVNRELCKSSRRLAINQHSLHHLFDDRGRAFKFDLVVYDESENAHIDAKTLTNVNEGNLKSILSAATLKIFADSDLGRQTYNLCEVINQESHDRLMLIENSYSHMRNAPQIIYENELDIYDALLECLINGERVFFHTGHKNGIATQYLATLVRVFNDLCNKEIAMYVDDGNSAKYPELFSDPNKYLGEKIKNGLQLFIVSPKIQTGWRYNNPDYQFDTAFGVYRNNVQTAPHIVQAANRCVGVSKYHWYISAKNVFTPLDQLELDFYQSHYAGEDYIEDWLGKIQYELSHTQNRTLAATKTLEIYRSSVFQHLIYMLQDYKTIIEPATGSDKSTHELWRELIEDGSLEEQRSQALRIHSDPAMLDALVSNFKGSSHPEGFDDTLDLLVRDERAHTNQEQIKELLSIIFGTEEERKQWALVRPYWARSEKSGYRLIGSVLDIALRNTDLSKENLEKVLNGSPCKILIEAEIFKEPEYVRKLDKHKVTLSSNLGTLFSENTTYPTLIRRLGTMLDLGVRGEKLDGVSLKKEKWKLVRHYMQKHLIKDLPDKDIEIETEIKKCKRILRGRYKLDKALTTEEENYLYNTGKYITIGLENGLHKIIADHLATMSLYLEYFRADSKELAIEDTII